MTTLDQLRVDTRLIKNPGSRPATIPDLIAVLLNEGAGKATINEDAVIYTEGGLTLEPGTYLVFKVEP